MKKTQIGSILCIFIFSVNQLANAQNADITAEVNEDGDGIIEVTVEYIYRRTVTSIRPPIPASARDRDEYFPPSWSDDPEEITAKIPYLWDSARIGSTGSWWGAFSTPRPIEVAASGSSDRILLGAVTTTGNAVVDSKINHEDGDLRSIFMSGIGEVQIEMPLVEEEVTFYSFIISPSVDVKSENPTRLNVAGAVLDFQWYANEDNIPSGYIRVLDGDEWINTGIYFGLEAGGKAKTPKVLTLRLDSEAGVWDLYFHNWLILADLGYVARENNIIITLGSEFHTAFGNIRITKSNPLFEDINKDGLPDSFEREHGYTPTTNNRQALIPGGTETLLEYYLNM